MHKQPMIPRLAYVFTVHDQPKTVIMTPEKGLQCTTLLGQGLRVSVFAR